MLDGIFQNATILESKLSRGIVHAFHDFCRNILMNEGNSVTVLELVALFVLIQAHRKAVAVSIDIVVCGIVGGVVFEEKVSILFDGVGP